MIGQGCQGGSLGAIAGWETGAVELPWPQEGPTMDVTIDHQHSHVGFAVQHMGIALVRGRFRDFDATIELDPCDMGKSKYCGRIGVRSIETGVAERDQHLLSADFFDAERFPDITFTSTRSEATADGQFRVTGELTLHGITRTVVVTGKFAGQPRRDPFGKWRTGFSAQASIDRREFGLTWNQVVGGGGELIGNMVEIRLDVELLATASDLAA